MMGVGRWRWEGDWYLTFSTARRRRLRVSPESHWVERQFSGTYTMERLALNRHAV